MAKQREEQIGGQRLILGDCLEVLPTLEAGSVDAVITDPPYNYGKKYNTHDDSMPWADFRFYTKKKSVHGRV